MVWCLLGMPNYKSYAEWGFLMSTHLGKFVLCLLQQQQSFGKSYPDDLHMMWGFLRVTIHLSWKPCVFSVHLLWLFAGWEAGMVQEWKKTHKTSALWLGKLVMEQKSLWSTSPCHWIAAGACGKVWISQSLLRLVFSASHLRNLLSRRWLCPVGLNKGISPLGIYLIHFLDHISAFGLSSFLWWWVPSCNKSLQASPHVSFTRGLVSVWLVFWQPQKALSLWRHGSVLEGEEGKLSTNQSNISGVLLHWFGFYFFWHVDFIAPAIYIRPSMIL